MSGTWLVDKIRIASKIKSASGSYDQGKVQWKSNPSKSCPNCLFVIDNSDVAHAWPGLPQGVKFDPSDEEIISHLLAKVGVENFKPHPFIDEFIPTIEEDDGICYTHPQNLPGVKPDGTVSHFFHRAIKAYNTGTRKRRKIHGDDSGDVRWHKTGRTKPVLLEGAQKGCKKIMVLYISSVRGGKAEKTNWVMHQYHLGTEEDEKEGQYVISKVFYQKLQLKQVERSEPDVSEGILTSTVKVDPVTPQSVTPEPHAERRFTNYELLEDPTFPSLEPHDETIMEIEIESPFAQPNDEDQNNEDNNADILEDKNDDENNADIVEDKNDNENNADIVEDKNDDEEASEGDKWWENESQFLLSSQQLVEGLSLCDEFLQSQSPIREESGNIQGLNSKPRLADYARLGPEDLKRDLEECQNLASDPSDKKSASDPVDTNLADIVLDSIPEFRLSQLEFESQDSYIAWGGSYEGGEVVD